MKYLKYCLIGIITVVTITFVSIPALIAAVFYYTPSSTNGNLASTTSIYVIGGTATTSTTKTIISDGLEQVSWFVALASSTTPPTLCWTNQYSNNGTDWYTAVFSSTTQLTIQSGEVQDCWIYSTTTTRNILSMGSDNKTIYLGRKIVVPNLDSVYTRTIFTINPSVAARIDIQSATKNTVIRTK